MNVYLAARYPRREELLKHVDELEDAGHSVVSSLVEWRRRRG